MKAASVKKRKYISITLLLIVFAVVIAVYMINKKTSVSQFYGYKIVNTYPHDPNAFTQGLVYENGVLYEGTGLNGHSSIRKVEIATGKVLQIYNMPDKYFGEGIAIWKDKIVQLTYQSKTGFVYDKETFKPLREFSYRTEGWGLTHDDKYLIMSDGTPTLSFLDPNTFELVTRVPIYFRGSLVYNINELEYIEGEVFANIWETNDIAIIDPNSGTVKSIIELDGLLNNQDIRQKVDVLNGIAYDTKNKRIFVTGKLWPKLFEIKLVSKKRLS